MTHLIKFITLTLAAFMFLNNVSAQTPGELESSRIELPNGWSLTPVGKNV